METARFDALTRCVSTARSRRALAYAIGLAAFGLPDFADARKKHRKHKHKRKHKKTQEVTFNAFGCVDVGNFCQSDDQCCSGICAGEQGKTSCQAHDDSGCPAGHQDSGCGGTTRIDCTTSSGLAGVCETTTGNAGYCVDADYLCVDCRKDADCQELCGRPEAACIKCLDCDGTATFQTACVGPFLNDCLLPG